MKAAVTHVTRLYTVIVVLFGACCLLLTNNLAMRLEPMTSPKHVEASPPQPPEDKYVTKGLRTEQHLSPEFVKELPSPPPPARTDDSACLIPPGVKYDAEYWRYQQTMGEFGAIVDNWKFKPYIKPTDKVLDFGCGGGYFLDKLAPNKATSMGLEVNPQAVLAARSRGLNVKMCVKALPNDYFDVIYSHHALEHIPDPFESLSQLLKKLKKGGKAVFVTPFDRNPKAVYVKGDADHHLWTWNPSLLGNLFAAVGFEVEECTSFQNQWPSSSNREQLLRDKGLDGFQAIAIKTAITNDNYQVRCVVKRPV